MTLDQKFMALDRVQGTLTAQEAATVASWLKKAKGPLFVAISETMKRCGAGGEALSVSTAVVSNSESPIEEWGRAMQYMEFLYGSDFREAEAQKSMKQARASLLDRLQHPLGKDQLVGLLTDRGMVWHPGNAWIHEDEVFQALCALLKDDSQEVRTQAAMVLTQAPNLEGFSSPAILGLVNVLIQASPAYPFPVNDLLRNLLGVGPDAKTPEAIKAFWMNWLQKEGKGFRLTRHALERAKSSAGMSRGETGFLARQVESSIGELPKEDCAKVWAAMLKVFEQDTSPPADRCSAWLYPLILIASRDECKDIRGEALSMLLKMSQDKDAILREKGLAQIGNLPGTTTPGSPSRAVLDRLLLDAKARPEERAMAAWSLKRAAKEEPALVERIVALAESIQRLPDNAFTTMTRTRCIGHQCAALMFATGKQLSLNPSEWRKVLADSLPPVK